MFVAESSRFGHATGRLRRLSVHMHRSTGVVALALVGSLTVAAQLAITEVHSAAGTNGTPAIHADWFEVANYGSQPLDLTGYRFNDSNGGLTNGTVTVPALVLGPGEAAIFVEAIPADDFRQWWGAGLPAAVPVAV
jgi:hypothetical protein